MYKGIVFDLDGTLVDSPLCFKSIRKQLGIPEGEYILEYLELLPEVEKKQKLVELEKIELNAAQKAEPFPGILNLLIELRDKKINLGVFTRNCTLATHYIIDFFKLTFELIVTRDDAPPKPDPTGIKKFLTSWNLEGHELLFVGDFRFDIECGKNAGVRTALFTNGQVYDETWNPNHVIPHYSAFWEHIAIVNDLCSKPR